MHLRRSQIQAVPRFLSDDIAKSSQAFSNSQLGCKRTITPAATRRKASEVFAAKNCHPFIPPHRNSALFVPYLSDIANFKWLAIENWNGHDYRNLCPSAQGISRLRSRKIFLLVQFSLVAAAFLIVQTGACRYLCIGNNRHHRRAERGSDSVTIGVTPANAAWTGHYGIAHWLHLSITNRQATLAART